MKITIIGTSGGGKSSLAKRISMNYAIPRLEIDRVWFSLDGHTVMNASPEEKAVVQEKIRHQVADFLSQNNHWVIDGTYTKIQPLIADQADTVVLIQRPLLKRVFSHIFRVVKGEDRHPEVSRWQDLCFTKTLFKRWKKDEDAHLKEFTKQYQDKLITLRSFREIDMYVDTLTKN